jgi:hypothetical protein
MDPEESTQYRPAESPAIPPLPCDGCEAALRSPDRNQFSFLLLGQLTTPVVGCEEHLGQFASTCGYTTEGSATLIEHRPAGGIRCPSCRLAGGNSRQPVVPVADGAVAIVGCPEHQSELLTRFRTGLETQQRLTTPLDISESADGS